MKRKSMLLNNENYQDEKNLKTCIIQNLCDVWSGSKTGLIEIPILLIIFKRIVAFEFLFFFLKIQILIA